MKILLTGASGMVGRNILEHTAAQSFEFLSPRRSELNLSQYSEVKEYLRQTKPNIIIHAAGTVGGIQANIREPVRFFVENYDMGRNVVMAACETGVQKLINLGSSCMYPRNEINPLKEESILTGKLELTNEGYALAKISVAKLCEYVSRENSGLQYVTVIPCNLYGRWDKFDPQYSHMIPAVIKKIHEATISGLKQIDIWGDGEARREFMYASDFADFILEACRRIDELPEFMNVGLGEDFTINEYYRVIAEVIGYGGLFSHDLTKPVGMQQKLVNIDKLKSWGWTHRHSLMEGIQKSYEFFQEQGRK